MEHSTLADVADRVRTALELEASGRAAEAQAEFQRILEHCPGQPLATLRVSRRAIARRDYAEATSLLQAAHSMHPDDSEVGVQLANMLGLQERHAEASNVLKAVVERQPGAHLAWLILGAALQYQGDSLGALKASHQAITRAQRAGLWLSEGTTPRELLPTVAQAIERVKSGRRELFMSSFDDLRVRHGSDALRRVDQAIRAYLNEVVMVPPDPNQHPLFFYFPELPSTAFHDPYLQPWAPALRDAFDGIRAEALRVVAEDNDLPDFIKLPKGAQADRYLGGSSPKPSWQAFFFYRRGKRFHENHERCPITSQILDSSELCRISDQAPEVCFSVLAPYTDIKPHYGVTNVRLVMHLPLIVPEQCALRVMGGGEREWREGELLMFDDTYQHEAWNRSTHTRIILLMDCWNPHLTDVERQACKQLIEMIGSLKAPAKEAG